MTGAVDQRRRHRAADPERDAAANAAQRTANGRTERTIAEIEARGVRADAAIGGRGQQGMEQLMRILGVRTRRVMETLDEVSAPGGLDPAELSDRVAGALAYVDALDEELSLVEAWLNRVRGSGLVVGVAARRRHHREALGLPAEPEAVSLSIRRTPKAGWPGSPEFAQALVEGLAKGGLTYEQMAVDWVSSSSPLVMMGSADATEDGADPDPYAFFRERYGLKLGVGTRVRVRWPLDAEKLEGVVVAPEPGSAAVRVELMFEDGISTVNVDARCVEVIHD